MAHLDDKTHMLFGSDRMELLAHLLGKLQVHAERPLTPPLCSISCPRRMDSEFFLKMHCVLPVLKPHTDIGVLEVE